MPNNELEADITLLEALPDGKIDLSDAPEVLDWSAAETGRFYRPVKKFVSIRLDADVIEWLKAREGQYQTAVNRILREYMVARRMVRER